MKLVVPVRRAVARLRPYRPPLEGRAGRLRLDFNENTVGCSPAARNVLARLGRERVAMYPEYEKTRLRLAGLFRVSPHEMLLTNGTDDALRLVVDTFVEARSPVLLVEPTFAMYRFYAELAGARIVSLRYDAGMRFPLAGALRALRARPHVFFLANPNNPTGTLLGRNELGVVLKAAANTIVVVDEAYADFSGVTVLDWIRRSPNLVVARTFSKAAGLAGLRLGCLFAHRAVVAALRRAHSPYAVNSAALAAALAAASDTRFLRGYVREVHRSRRELCAALTRLGIKTFPSAGNFVLAHLGPRAPQILRSLRRLRILLRDRQSDFGRVGYVRITVGTRAQTRKLVRALETLWTG